MYDQPTLLLDKIARLHVLVIGEAMLDCYFAGASHRLCPEAPVPVVDIVERQQAPGGAANVAVNVRGLGAGVSLLTVVGQDAEGNTLKAALQEHGVLAGDFMQRWGRRTLAKTRVVAAGQLLVRFDQGETAPLDPEDESELLERLNRAWTDCDAAIVSDYGYGIMTPRLIEHLAWLQQRDPRVLVVDARNLCAYRGVPMTAIKPNFKEALHLLGLEEASARSRRVEVITAHGRELLEKTGARIAAVTMDTDGALIFERDRAVHRAYAPPNLHARAAGAGDTFVSGLTLGLAAGLESPQAAELASAAAAVVVAKDGTSWCSTAELLRRLARHHKVAPDLSALADHIALDRQHGRRIVFTNGCFDLLHRGHVAYLSQAKALGDVLVVGVNADETIRRLKGPERPINALDDRMHVLAALSCIDHLVAFGEDTPHNLIRAIRPHVFVKGGDYTRERLPEAALVEELGGVVRILPLTENRSTSGLLERIRAATLRTMPAQNACRKPASRRRLGPQTVSASDRKVVR